MKHQLKSNTIAVLIPVYNRPALLKASLKSIGGAATVVVVDDGSVPPLSEVELDYAGPIVLLQHGRNQGIVAALNTGLAYIMEHQFEFVARLDAGDLALPGRLERQRDFLVAHPEYGLVGSRIREIGGTQLFLADAPSAVLKRRQHISSQFAHPAVMLKISVCRDIGLYRAAFAGVEDWDYWFRLARRYEVKNLPEVLTELDGTPGSLSRDVKYRIRVRRRYLKAKVLCAHFDFRLWESYTGLLRAMVVFTVNLVSPPALILARGRLAQLGRQRRRGASSGATPTF